MTVGTHLFLEYFVNGIQRIAYGYTLHVAGGDFDAGREYEINLLDEWGRKWGFQVVALDCAWRGVELPAKNVSGLG